MTAPGLQEVITRQAIVNIIPVYASQIAAWNNWLRKNVNSVDTEVQEKDFPLMSAEFVNELWYAKRLSYTFGWFSMESEIEKKSQQTFAEPTDAEFYTAGYKQALDDLRNKPIISAKDFKAGDATLKGTSFSVQRIETMRALEKVNKSLQEALREGITVDDWKDQLDEMWAEHGITPLKTWHIEVVFRTNLQSVYNTARWESIQASRVVEYVRYDAIDDDRTTIICSALSGQIWEKNDGVWETVLPPNHYQCRSGMSAVFREEIEKLGGASERPSQDVLDLVHPDFRNPPMNLSQYADNINSIEV